MRNLPTLSLFLCALALAPAALAEDAQSTPVTEWIAAENALIDGLSQEQKESIFIIRNKHSVIRSVRVVHRDIENAVDACGEANPDMEDRMEGRLAAWEKAVLPILDSAQDFLDDEIEAQQIVDPSDFENVLDMNDEAFEYGESMIHKQVVTEKDACEDLLDSMDRTEDQLVNLMLDMLIPESVIKKRLDDAGQN